MWSGGGEVERERGEEVAWMDRDVLVSHTTFVMKIVVLTIPSNFYHGRMRLRKIR